jgi:hypothetical protein
MKKLILFVVLISVLSISYAQKGDLYGFASLANAGSGGIRIDLGEDKGKPLRADFAFSSIGGVTSFSLIGRLGNYGVGLSSIAGTSILSFVYGVEYKIHPKVTVGITTPIYQYAGGQTGWFSSVDVYAVMPLRF